MADVKLCKDCKWCVPGKRRGLWSMQFDYGTAKCAHKSAATREVQALVDGLAHVFCSTWRGEYAERCGPEGKFWEPR